MSIRSIFMPFVIVLALAAVPGSNPAGTSAQAAEPQIIFSGNGLTIVSGDDTPRPEDGTDFGSTAEGAPLVRLFLIGNQGTADLLVNVVSVPTGFAVTPVGVAILPATVVPNGALLLLVRCDAAAAGTYSGFVSITSNDPINGRAGFAISCRVNAQPEIDVAGNTIPIANGDTTPSAADATDFGTPSEDVQVTHVFTISNRGAGDLTIGDLSVPDGFSLLTTPPTVLPASGAADIEVRCDARDPGSFNGVVLIESNDVDESTFRFTIHCLVQGDDEPTFNPSPDDLPPPSSTVTAPVTVTTPSSGSNQQSDTPGSNQVSATGGDSGTQVPSAGLATSTPTLMPAATATVRANTGVTQGTLRPPSTGSAGLQDSVSGGIPAWSLLPAFVAIGSGVGFALSRRALR